MDFVRVFQFYLMELLIAYICPNAVPGHRLRLSEKFLSNFVSIYTIWSGDHSHLVDYFIYRILSTIILMRNGIVTERPHIIISLSYYMFSIALVEFGYKKETTENLEFTTIVNTAYISNWLGNLHGSHLIISNACVLISVPYYWFYKALGSCMLELLCVGYWITRTMFYRLEIYKSFLVLSWQVRGMIFAYD